MSLFPVARMSFLGDTVSDLDRVFDSFLNMPARVTQSHSDKLVADIPRANILASKKGYFIEMAAPGFSRGDFDISVEDNILTISLSTEDNSEYLSNLKRREFNYSSFTRSWALPEGSSIENITAHYVAGILKIGVPADTTSQISRQIEVQ